MPKTDKALNAAAAATGKITTISFDRLGRSHSVPDLVVKSKLADDADYLAEEIFKYARKYLISSGVEVVVNLDKMTATVYAGMQVGGTGKIVFTEA